MKKKSKSFRHKIPSQIISENLDKKFFKQANKQTRAIQTKKSKISTWLILTLIELKQKIFLHKSQIN